METENNNEQERQLEVRIEAHDNAVVNMLDVLAALASVQRSHTEITVSFDSLTAAGYGPKEWIFQIVDRPTCRFSVLKIGPNNTPYIIRNPFFEGSFSDIDSFVTYMLSLITRLLDLCYTLYREPAPVTLNHMLVAEPQNLGFPLDALLGTEIPPEIIHQSVAPYCVAHRGVNANYSRVSLFEGLNIGALRDDLMDVHRNVMPNLRLISEEMHEHVRNSRLPESEPVPLTGNILLGAIANPVHLNLMFSHIPRRVHLSTTFVGELLLPELDLSPMSASGILSLGGQSASRITCVNALTNISFDPIMNNQIGTWFLSLLSPGAFHFTVSFDDLNMDDVYTRALAGLAAKLLLAYNVTPRWNGSSNRTVHAVEQAIVNAGLEAGILESANNAELNPLSRVVPTHDSQLRHLDLLQTTNFGGGWRDSGRMMYGAIPAGVPYLYAQNRQLVATNLDNKRLIDTGDGGEAFVDWPVRRGAYDFLCSIARGRYQKTPMMGVNGIFQALSKRLMNFYISFNDYAAHNWYTSLRLSEADANNLFGDDSETPAQVIINGKTLLFMLKSLSGDTIKNRKHDYDVQFKAESAIMRDCIETSARAAMWERLFGDHGLNAELYTHSERWDTLLPTSGPLSLFFQLLKQSGMYRDLGPFYECAHQDQMHEIYTRIVTMICDNPLDFGVLPELLLRSSMPLRRLGRMRDLAHRNLPYTNTYTDEIARLAPVGEPLQDNIINFNALQRMLGSYSALESIREYSLSGTLRLAIPTPLRIETGVFPSVSTDVISIDYTKIDSDRNLRLIMKIKGVPFTVISIDATKLSRPDLYLSSACPYETTFIQPHHANRILVEGNAWLGALGTETFDSPAVRTGLVAITSFFARS